MNPTYRLEKLRHSATKRLAKLRAYVSVCTAPLKPLDDVTVAWAVIETLTLWAAFLRAYYLSGAMGTKTGSGTIISFKSITFANREAAIRFAIRELKDSSFKKSTVSRRDEPPWHDARNFVKLQKTVGPTNLTQVYAAFSAGMTFAEFLPTIRNFYAHRCDETFRKAARIGVKLGLTTKPTLRPTSIVCSRLAKRPQNIITDWLDEMRDVVDLLCS